MRYTPLDVRHQDFPTSVGGYRKTEVRSFLADLAEDIEARVTSQQALTERVAELETQLQHYRQSEDDLRRAVMGAERMAGELRENARREAELITSQAELHRESVMQQANARAASLEAHTEARAQELETLHRTRSTELEAAMANRSTHLESAYNARFSELEGLFHRRHRELEQGLSARTAYLEAVFSQRHNELSTLLSRAREEQAQFVAQYRALVGSFHQLAARYLTPDTGPLPLDVPSIAAPEPQALGNGAGTEASGTDIEPVQPTPEKTSPETQAVQAHTQPTPTPTTEGETQRVSVEEQRFV